jgi:HSP20 family protein
MALTKPTALAARDPLRLIRQTMSEMDRLFEGSAWPAFPTLFSRTAAAREARWFPEIDVFERDNRLITKVDLPGLKKEDVKVEVADGRLAISGERRTEAEEKKEDFYRCEREYGSFYRAVPLPAGVKLEDVKATFADGVLEVSLPLTAQPEVRTRRVEIEDTRETAVPVG